MERLSLPEAIRASGTGIDQHGLLLDHGGRLYRAFRGEHAALIRRVLDDPHREDLFDAGLVRFREADLEVESFDLVVEAERVERVTFPTEWPTEMLRAAAVAIARLAECLARHGMGLKDSHPWNVLFAATQPVFVDLGSLVGDPTPTRAWRREFRRHLLLPLLFHHRGWHRAADALMREHPVGLLTSAMDSRVGRLLVARHGERLARATQSPEEYYRRLAELCESLDAAGTPMTWSSYDQPPVAVGDVAEYSGKQRAVAEFLQRVAPGTLLDLACNQGWYSRLAVDAGYSTISTDIDDMAVGILYRRAVVEDLDILPLRLDIVWPRGSYGLGLAHSEPYGRIRSEVVMALAVIHHLVRNHELPFATFARLIDKVAVRAAIIEFIPPDDAHVATWGVPDWYNEARFVEAMSAYFPRVTRLPSSPEPRLMFLFERS